MPPVLFGEAWQKHSFSLLPKRENLTQHNFHFLSAHCRRSENVCDIGKLGAQCSISFQKRMIIVLVLKNQRVWYGIFAFISKDCRKSFKIQQQMLLWSGGRARGPAEQFPSNGRPGSVALLNRSGSCHKARGRQRAVRILIAPVQTNNKRCSSLILLMFFFQSKV